MIIDHAVVIKYIDLFRYNYDRFYMDSKWRKKKKEKIKILSRLSIPADR